MNQPRSAGRSVQVRRMQAEKARQPAHQRLDVVLARHVHAVLAVQLRRHIGAAQEGGDLLLDEFRLAFLENQDRGFVFENSTISSGTSGYTTFSARIGRRLAPKSSARPRMRSARIRPL